MHPVFRLSRTGLSPSVTGLSRTVPLNKKSSDPVQPSPYTSQPRAPEGAWFRLFRVRSPLLTESLLMSLPPGTKMFQFPGCASPSYVFRCVIPRQNRGGFSHSDTPGSKPAWRLPEVYRSLLRPSSLFKVKASTMRVGNRFNVMIR